MGKLNLRMPYMVNDHALLYAWIVNINKPTKINEMNG